MGDLLDGKRLNLSFNFRTLMPASLTIDIDFKGLPSHNPIQTDMVM